MRITQTLLMQHEADTLTTAYTRLFKLQEQLSSGKRLVRPSDAPSSIRPALDLRSARRQLAQSKSNAELASSDLSTADGVLRDSSDLVARARELAVAGANGAASQADRDAMANEVDGLLDQLIALANGRGASGFLFGGARNGTAPFERIETADGTHVLYHGDDKTAMVGLGGSLELALNVPGSDVFGHGTRTATSYGGVTGAAAGTGNDSATGTDKLTVAHTLTVLGDGLLGGGDSVSGLKVGASSVTGDTLLGPAGASSLTLVDTSGTGSAGTISLNGGPAVNWTASDADLAVTAATGEVVHVDLSNVAAGFSGNVSIRSDGTFSLDGGATTAPIDFTNQNQIVTDSQTGGAIFVDARNVRRAGVDLLRFTGSYDLFSTLVELRDALKNGEQLPLDQQLDRISATADSLSSGEERMLAALARIGSRMRVADATRSRADELDVLLVKDQSNLEDVDFSAASIELSQAQLVLQAGVAISARIGQLPSLATLL